MINEYREMKRQAEQSGRAEGRLRQENYLLRHQLSLVQEKMGSNEIDLRYTECLENQRRRAVIRKESEFTAREMVLTAREELTRLQESSLRE